MAKRTGCLRWGLALYLILLLASHATRRLRDTPPPPPGLETVAVQKVDGERRLAETTRLFYREWPADRSDAPVLVALHGSPGSSADFSTLGPALAGEFRVVAPDLPGFGASLEPVPDYSIRAHADYALQLLDALGIQGAHLLGFSMGGGIAIHLADREPRRSRSLVLLSAIGVQELELLGSYRLNHSIHGAQLAFLWLLHEAVPHFGLLDRSMLSVAYARNFFDSDQRPLRAALARLETPALIVHGRNDILVPAAAAREHHRLMPHSELRMLEANHFIVFRRGERLARPIGDFLRRVEAGRAPRRDAAKSERLRRAAQPFDPRTVPRASALTLIVLMGLIALATLVTEDLACIAAGLLVARGRLGFWTATGACFAGILIGDLALFWAGRLLGRRWLDRRPLRWLLSPQKVELSSAWFRRRGPIVIFLSRFLPGTRVGTYFTAGLLHTSFWRFLFYFCLAVAIWTPVLVWLARTLGGKALRYFEHFQFYALPGFLLLALLIWGAVELAEAVATRRGRRLLLGWWIRKRRWEFWPPWVFYPPLVLWYLVLAARYRSLTLFSAANPGIPGGGFMGESKTAILDRLPRDAVARYRAIPAGRPAERRARLEEFVRGIATGYPLVLKPDVGERGRGVLVARSAEEAEAYLADNEQDILVQEYVGGREYGVFYLRRPDKENGTIFSITEKRLPEVEGDGTSTVEQLILRDRRAVALARTYLAALGDRAGRVPAAGERVRITDLGTHCRGAVFLDGTRLRTPALRRRVDEIARGFHGFCFGRFDVRVPSEEALTEGRELTVLELNGVSSEATHIYDPSFSLRRAYGVLFRQWRLAFEIGRMNRDRGASPASAARLLASLFGARMTADHPDEPDAKPAASANTRPRSR